MIDLRDLEGLDEPMYILMVLPLTAVTAKERDGNFSFLCCLELDVKRET